MVPLSQIASLIPAVTPIVVNHQGQFPSVTLSFNLAPGVTIGAAVSAVLLPEAICDVGRERIEADIIAGPAWTLEGRAFSAATGAACAGTQFVA